MGKAVRSVREALSKFVPDHECWDTAHLNWEGRRPVIEQLYRGYEWLDYRWVFSYRLTRICARALIQQGWLQQHPTRPKVFILTKKGEEKCAPPP